MKHLIRNALVAVLGVGVAGLVGCEWGGGGEDNSWNDSNSIANFNGSYQANGSYLVSDYSASGGSSGGGGTANGTSYINRSETQTKHVQLQSVIAGQASYSPILEGSFSIHGVGSLNGLSVHDDGSGSLVGDSFMIGGSAVSVSGFVVYSTGAWSITLAGGGSLDESSDFNLSYSQVLSSSGSTPATTSGSSGASGVSIYAFNVQQTGNKLKIVDNNGSVYEGSFGDIRTTGNLGSASGGAEFVNGDQVIGSFSASGTSAAGVHVNMTGTFQGTAAGVSKVTTKSGDSVSYTISMALSDRRIMGTWIEDGGKTGNINGISPSAVNVTYAGNTSTNAVP